jgi:hypothetical protein
MPNQSPKRPGFGPVELKRVEWEEVNAESDGLSANRIVPAYPATEGSNPRLSR